MKRHFNEKNHGDLCAIDNVSFSLTNVSWPGLNFTYIKNVWCGNPTPPAQFSLAEGAQSQTFECNNGSEDDRQFAFTANPLSTYMQYSLGVENPLIGKPKVFWNEQCHVAKCTPGGNTHDIGLSEQQCGLLGKVDQANGVEYAMLVHRYPDSNDLKHFNIRFVGVTGGGWWGHHYGDSWDCSDNSDLGNF